MAETPNGSRTPPKLPPAEGAAPKPRPAQDVPPRRPPRRKPEAAEQSDAFSFTPVSSDLSTSAAFRNRRRKSSTGVKVFLFLGGSVAIGLAVALIMRAPRDNSPPFSIKPVTEQRVDELAPLQLAVEVDTPEDFTGTLRFALGQDSPKGASIDAETGKFSWKPAEYQGPGRYDLTVYVADANNPRQEVSATFTVVVNEDNRPPLFEPIENRVVSADAILTLTAKATDPDTPSQQLRYGLAPGGPNGAVVEPATGQFRWIPQEVDPEKSYHFEIQATELSPGGLTSTQGFDVRVEAPPTDVATAAEDFLIPEPAEEEGTEDSPPPIDIPEAEPSPREKADAKILALFEEKNKANLFSRSQYTTLRKIYADLFEQEHRVQLKQAFGDDYEVMTAWLDEHLDIKEELYTAFDPDVDKLVPALTLLGDIRKQFPEKIAAYGELAIATALVWDSPRRGVYKYKHHAKRAKSKMPINSLAAMDNFKYLVETEDWMQGRVRFMPWEFLTLVVNHTTPLSERQWAMKNYVHKRQMFGSCYKDVPYDDTMLNSESEVARLNDKDYNLPNLLTYGGVCAYQADYASRVGKSMGVPAAYVTGKSAYGEEHAWVMWVELLGVTADKITFSLESFGRYRGDKYYVGHLSDPHTGKRITDRQLELRLQTVGLDPQAKRHAQLVMKSFPMLREQTKMDVNAQFKFLYKVTDMCAGNEDAWRSLAKMSRGGLITKKNSKEMMEVLTGMFRIFKDFPDFTWEIFDDLIAFQDDSKQRGILYGQLVQLYEAADRPDLACEARLKFVDYLVAEEEYDVAIDGLASAIMKFPKEGCFVPKMLDRLEELCKKVGNRQQDLLDFYKRFLPMIPQMRGSRPSDYCIEMFQRAIQRFRAAGDMEAASACQIQLGFIRAGKGERPVGVHP